MSWEYRLRLGEFTSVVRLVEAAADIPVADLTLVDSNTRDLAPWGEVFVIPPGEEHKRLSTVEDFLDRAAQLRLGRDSVLAGAGGGVVCDMAAFAASLYMRGSRLVLVPTTLLAMVDAAIGGKTGVDFRGWKNLIGTFYPAHEVVIWPGVLDTLPVREYLCGLAEVVKHALLMPDPLLGFLERHRGALLERRAVLMPELIRLSVQVKIAHVEADFRESGLRAHLNLGHTFAHALESATGFQDWKHGEAVAWGLLRALVLGWRLGLTDPGWVERVRRLLDSLGYRLTAPGVDPDAVLEAMAHDKKKRAGEIRFVVQRGPGDTLLVTPPAELVREVVVEGILG